MLYYVSEQVYFHVDDYDYIKRDKPNKPFFPTPKQEDINRRKVNYLVFSTTSWFTLYDGREREYN